ncbi:hypothetical protein CC2G_011974 [Coprinopsis cinerea AmutBmut pab1-1]|nr:hypothetical protein CC2G_011974 [Coprinopsis cinerea AmutBmut pab1-1]
MLDVGPFFLVPNNWNTLFFSPLHRNFFAVQASIQLSAMPILSIPHAPFPRSFLHSQFRQPDQPTNRHYIQATHPTNATANAFYSLLSFSLFQTKTTIPPRHFATHTHAYDLLCNLAFYMSANFSLRSRSDSNLYSWFSTT